ncbi:4-alpha-glucanotransferase [Indioceanicola profundi]|uniref:4-alpha-glucanotransferase n=1 Tax=Indioceanicola profundi TaxID=2220096 RepID=UPI000E6ADEC4
MNLERASGILLHPTCLPGGHGIGDLGPAARHFVDQLAEAGQSWWQILPLGPTSAGNSPYSALSTFAGNPLLISFDDLIAEGLADSAIQYRLPQNRANGVDYGDVVSAKLAALDEVCANFLRRDGSDELWADFDLFRARHEADWLDDYALFIALKDRHRGRPWQEWNALYVMRDPMGLSEARHSLGMEIRRIKVQQFLFFRQWERLRAHAHSKGVRIIGDIPIFVAGDSADVWSKPHLFELDNTGRPTLVAGVPPDYFSATGQLWGNPLYRWDAHRAEGFAWWQLRMAKTLEMVDLVRVDHFRGFEAYWEIPAGQETAINGRWVPAPGYELFQSLRDRFGDVPVIAEDLGIITDEVERLRDHFGFPGMRVLPFEWGEDFHPERSDSSRHPENRIFYTGTHDNDTILGWFRHVGGVDSDTGRAMLDFLHSNHTAVHWDFIRYAMETNARLAVVPVQDVLGLGTEARMNIPGVADGNWAWRLQPGQFDHHAVEGLRALTERTSRLPGQS